MMVMSESLNTSNSRISCKRASGLQSMCLLRPSLNPEKGLATWMLTLFLFKHEKRVDCLKNLYLPLRRKLDNLFPSRLKIRLTAR